MDHHHRHHTSHHHHHLQGHSSRYAPFPHQQPPATPVLLAPDPYRRPPHLSFSLPSPPAALPPPLSAAAHYHRPDVVYVSYGPSSSHASDGHGRLLAPAKALHPHLPAVRVSERIIFPEGHPEAPRVHHNLRRSSSSCGGGGGGEAFVREDFKRERVRVLDEGQAGPPYGRRGGEAAVELAEQEEVARRLGLLGRKRSRLEDGRALGEDTLLGCFLQEREPKRLTSGATTSRRRCDVMYDLRAMGVESSRGSAPVFVSERGDTVLAFPRLPAEVPLRSSPVYSSVSKPELLGKSPIMEPETLASGGSHDFREKNLVGRGKRCIFGGEEEVHALPRKAPQQKPSVLSRIQFANPVYKRRCEQQIRSTTSPPPVSQTLAFSEGNQFEMDVPVKLDVSFKSDALVAKEILPSPVSSLRRSAGEVCGARITKKNAAKITTVSPSTSFLKSHDKVTAMHSYKLKVREERFAHSYAGGKPNKERIPKKKVTNNILVSSNSTLQNFADEVTGSRTPKNKVANEVSISPNPVQSSADRVSPVRVTEKKMAEKIVALPHASVQSCDGKITSTRSPKRKPAKGILAPQGNVMPSFSDRIPTLETLELPSCDGIITIERCPEEKPAREIVVNSINAEMDIGVKANSSESTGKKLVKETLVAQKAVSLHCSEKVTSVNGPKKEVLDNISRPSVPVVPTAEENSIIDRPKEKQGKDTFTSLSSVVNSDKRITTLRTLKKKIIKRNKKKKVVAAIDPCLPSMDPSDDCSKEHVLTNSPLKMEPSRMLASTMASSHMEKKYLKEESRDVKDLGIVQKVSASGSSGEDMKELKGVHVKFVSGDHEGMSSTTVRSLKKEVVKRKNTGEFTLFSCGVDSCPVQEICEMPILNSAYADPNHSKEVQRGSLSKCSQEDPRHSEAHSDALQGEVHQDILEAGEVHGGSVPDSYQNVGHLDHKSSAQATACTDENFQGRGQDHHILMGRHNDVTRPVLPERAETSEVGELGVDNSTLELHLQRIMLPGHLEADTTEAPSNALASMKVDISPKKKSSIEKAAEDLKSSVKHEESRGDGNVYLREDSGSGKHLSALEQNFSPDTVCDKEVHDEGMASLDGRNSCKADIKSSDREIGQELSPGRQSSPLLEELEMVSCEKDACAVLPCHLQSSLLQVEAHTTIPELEKERKQSVAPGVISIETNLGEVDSEKNIVGGERSRELHAKAQDAILDTNLLIETDGLVGGVLQLPFTDAFPQSSPSVIRVEGSAVNSMVKQVAEGVHSSPLDVSEENSPEILATVSEIMHFAEMKQSVCDLLDNKNCHGDGIVEKPYGDSNGKSDYLSDSMTLPAVGLKLIDKSDLMNLSDCLISGKTLPAQTQEADKQLIKSHQPTGKGMLTSMKECQGPRISKIYPNQKSLSARTFKKPASHSIRNNKWYRMENPPVSCSPGQMKWPSRSLPRQSPKKLGKIQSSYIRKGNSLIRKPSPAIPSSYPYPEQTALDQICLPETNKTMSSEQKINITDHFNFSSARALNSSFERPKTPPLPLSNKLMHPSLDSPQTLRDDPLSEPVGLDTAIPSVGTQGFDLKEANHSICLAEESKISGKKKLIYVKHRSNQLIAAPVTDANNTSVHTTEEGLALPFAPPDIYYRRKNKLIRDTSLSDGQLKQEMSHSNDCSGATCHGPSKMSSLKDGAKVPRKTRLEKAMGKTYKQSRFSLVWRLNGTQSQDNKCSNVSKHQKVLPYLFPWKRSMCWRGFSGKMGSNWTKHSPSLISRKLQLSRQRDTIYTISNSGFSLRKSGVLSAGGSNLKWSKSMERRSRKASEEAALAVVEHERKKKKHKGTTCADLAPKSENCSQRERVFRVGTIHYKMDSSRRTLVRIPDEQTLAAANSQTVAGAKISIVPRRLVIGNDEYIRVGNGNQLIRDPKKLVRILANEKIRWSLHTARLRSVRKQQYCQFFTRFGKCNKEDGKCPFIHDPTKIAICTKFLKGLCSGPNCKLTHKVIPERMPDCSYFLKGLCTNISCPYRHVNVNSKAPVCEGFLKGYCRDGDECRKKHSHVCPYFEASGECHHGSMCKLHHPKRANKQANKSRKRKRSPIHDHGRGRYFGCSVAEVGESQAFASNMDIQKKDEDIFFHEGRFTEYISLDVDSDDAVGFNDPTDSHPILMDFDLSDSQLSDADALIKPVRIMKMAVR